MKSILKFPASQMDWVLLYCRFMSIFALQGVVLLTLYALRGFETNPDLMPPGLRLDPTHSVIHLVTGLLGMYFGFLRPSGALLFLRIFTVFYLLLAVFGTFTDIHFGMQLEFEENTLHWPLAVLAGLIAFTPLFSTHRLNQP